MGGRDRLGRTLAAVVVSRWISWRDLHDIREQSLDRWIRSRTRRGWFDALLRDSTEFVLVLNADAKVLFASPAATTRLAFIGPTPGQPLAAVVSDWTTAQLQQLLAEAAVTGDTCGPYDMTLIQRDGSRCQVEVLIAAAHDVEFKGFVLTATDVTATRRLQSELEAVRSRDRLTGLLTWGALSEEIREVCAASSERDRIALLVMDITDFGTWNQRLGRDEGDQILRTIADVFESLPPSVKAVARLEADTFAWLIVGPEAAREVSEADRIASDMLANLILPDDTEVSMFFQAGFTVHRANLDVNPQRLLEEADVALRRARVSRGTHLVGFRAGMNEDLVRRLTADADLRGAIAEDRIEVFYQPVVELNSRTTVGLEALVRLRTSEGELLPPDTFIPLAEEIGVIGDLGHRVRHRAVRDVIEVERLTGRVLSVAVNVSPKEIDSTLVIDTADLLAQTGLAPERLTVEVTESSLHEHIDVSVEVLRAIRSGGSRVAMDDFGTGYSSLSALVSLPMDVLKIDRAFVDAMNDSPQALALVRTIVRLADALGLDVVAEGIETLEQSIELRSLRCRLGQGYLYARPMPFDELVEFLGPLGGQLRGEQVASRPAASAES